MILPNAMNELGSTFHGKQSCSFATNHDLLTFASIESIQVQQEGPVQISPVRAFADAGLHPVMLQNISLAGYRNPTPIQKYTIPAIVQGRDVIGIAQTGKVLVLHSK